MLTVQQAFSILSDNLFTLLEVEYPLLQAKKHVLSQDIYSPINMPPFRQSAMDGYAICIDSNKNLAYSIIGEIKAGDTHQVQLLQGQAVKIFTGAAVPDSANAVVQIEKVRVENSKLILQQIIAPETNIRPIGEQISKNDLALKKGTELNAAAIGFLAGLGITKTKVYKKPTVGIVVTGNELIKPGLPLEYGKIYESNGIMLHTALTEAYFNNINFYEVNDNFENTKNTLETALNSNDVVIVSGGISVGDYDFVETALKELQVQTLFYKVNQKPGKPLYVGKKDNKFVFALPGNPAACLTCFYVYVKPVLNCLSGKTSTFQQTISKKIAHDYVVNNTRAQFLKAIIQDDEVTVLSHQNSSMLNTFSVTNALVFLPEGNYELKKDSNVTVYQIL